jgi:type I restriction enzyme S subunit
MVIENSVLAKQHTTLGQISRVLKKGIFDIKSSTYQDSGIPFARISNLKNMGISTNDIIYIPEEENAKNLNTYLEKGDVILSKTAYPAASIVQLDNCNTSQDTVAIKLKKGCGIDSSYLVSFLNSKYGFFQMQRWFTGNIQMHLNLTDSKGIFIYQPSDSFQKTISEIFWDSFDRRDRCQSKNQEAENLLLETLGLADFQPSQEPVNVKSFSESFGNSGRLDAEYFQLNYEEILSFIEQNTEWDYLKNLTTYISNGNQPPYSEKGEIRFFSQKWIGDKSIDYSFLKETEEPMVEKSFFEDEKNKSSLVGQGDILYYSVGANLGYCHNYLEKEKIAVGSFINIIRADESKVDKYYLGVVLNSIIGRMQGDREKSGIAQPYIYAKNIREFKIPIISKEKQVEIANKLWEGFNLNKQSEHLLEVVKSAIEIAIEQDEETAIAFINENVK